MKLSRRFLDQCAGETGFQPAALEKVIRLGELAGEISRHPLFGEALLLKGGTPLNLCFGTPKRLSVDLDFNYIGAEDRETMQVERPEIEAALEDLAGRLGYRVQRSADAFAGRKFYLRYQPAVGSSDRIEVDLNYLFRVPIGESKSLEMWQPGALDRPVVRVVSMDELCIGKILAYLNRTAPRDAWDVSRLAVLAGPTLSTSCFRNRLLALSAILDHPISTYDRLRLAARVTARAVSEQLWPMLTQGDTPAPETLVDVAWQVMEPFLNLTEREREFVDAISRGQFRGDLLELEKGSREDLAAHPAIRWKLKNVNECTLN